MMEARNRDIQIYKKDQIIFKEGDEANCMYDIHCGEVGIYANYGTKEEKLLTTLHSENFFGEMGLVDGAPRSATAVALEKNTKVEIITRESFGAYLQEYPAKVLMVMQNMSHRLRDLTKDYLEVCGTVAETVDAEKNSKEKNEGLQKKIKKFSDIYWKSVQSDVEAKTANYDIYRRLFL